MTCLVYEEPLVLPLQCLDLLRLLCPCEVEVCWEVFRVFVEALRMSLGLLHLRLEEEPDSEGGLVF